MAFFAKGRIKGDFLLTAAYDSAREKEDARDRLHGTIEPDRYYLLYGDGTEQRFEAASQSKLYLKIERRQFVALFGDFDTGFTVTELTRYNRSLSGLRADFGGERVQVSGFAARTDTGLVQDELQGDGTSGLYHLSRAPIVIGCDKLHIEVRDRFEITRVVDTRELSRFIDYDLDYERGTVFFKEPVPSRDHELNPIFIVADYEVRTGGEDETAAGVRVATKLAADKLELGASAVFQGAQAGDTHIVGSDLTWRVSAETRVRAEVAQSQSDDPLRPEASTAWLVEGNHASEHLEARAWARETGSGFGVDQQLTADTGTRSAGVDARYKFTESLMVSGEVQHQDVLASDAIRLLVSADVRMNKTRLQRRRRCAPRRRRRRERRRARLRPGFRHGQRRCLGWPRDAARCARMRRSSGEDESVDYPARSLIGVDYHLSDETTLFVEYEHAEGSQIEADMTRIGMRTRPWERTQVKSSINTQATEYGPRTFANFGLTQGFKWKDTLGLRYRRRPVQHAARAGSRAAQSERAARLGLDDRRFLRGVRRRAVPPGTVAGSRAGSSIAIPTPKSAGARPPAGTASRSKVMRCPCRCRRSTTSTLLGGGNTEAVGRLAWAFRPDSSNWIVFDRFELKYDEHTDCAERVRIFARGQQPARQLAVESGAAARHAVRRALRVEHLRRRGVRRRVRSRRPRPAPPAHAPLRPRACTPPRCIPGNRTSWIIPPASMSARRSRRTCGSRWATTSRVSATTISPAAATRRRARTSRSASRQIRILSKI